MKSRPGREFGSATPTTIYIALRWNDKPPKSDVHDRMVVRIAKKLNIEPEELRIYNLVRPSKDRGMSLSVDELGDVEETIENIRSLVSSCGTVQRIIVGGKSGPMPMAALLLKFLVPGIRIEIRNHHKARAATATPLEMVKVLRKGRTK